MLKTESKNRRYVVREEVSFSDASCYPVLPSPPSGFFTSTPFPYHQQLPTRTNDKTPLKTPKHEKRPIDFFTNTTPTTGFHSDDLHSLVSPSSPKRPRPSSLLTSYQHNNNNNNNNLSIPNDSKNELARRRRQKISEKTRCLSKLMPWDTQMDTATMLEEARKYVMFLQAQAKSLQSMPPSIHYNATTSFENGSGILKMLNRQQLLQVLVNSPVVQTRLYKQGCCVYSVEQLMMLPSDSTTTSTSRSF